MKRCPQCEFLYEDNQRLCDMDGIKLVFDSRKLPNLNALAGDSAVVKPTWRSRTVALLAGLVLTTVFYLVYQVQPRQTRVATTPAANSTPIQPQMAPIPAASLSGAQPEASSGDSKPGVSAPKSEETPPSVERAKPKSEKSSSTSKKTKPKKTSASAESRTVSEKKNESKFASFLKKTGKILKKPFKR